MKKLARELLLRIHRDTRGAMSILVLLIVWCLVALVGMLYNNVEQTRQRERLQAAADSAAHATATWMARTGNAITAQNMVISQDVSAESIWQAVPPTDAALIERLEGELKVLQSIVDNPQSVQQQSVDDLQTQLAQIGTDLQLTTSALTQLELGTGANYADINEALTYRNRYRQVRSVISWVQNTYLEGQRPPAGAPGAPPRPGPPGPNGEGIIQLVSRWQDPRSTGDIATFISNYIRTVEMPYLRGFENQTAYARAQPFGALAASHRDQVYQTEVATLQTLAATAEAQRHRLADFYQAQITLATLQNAPGNTGPARIIAPYALASSVPSVTGHVDLIRIFYWEEAAAAGLSPIVNLDAINIHAHDSRIWHPDLPAAPPFSLSNLYGSLKPVYSVPGEFPEGWGHNYSVPLERYVRQRVARDLRQIDEAYMTPLDRSRTGTLALEIGRRLGLPTGLNVNNVRDLPGTLPDDQPAPQIPPPPPVPVNSTQPAPPPPPPVFDTLFVLPRLTAPVNATAVFRTAVTLYNQNAARYTADIRRLRRTGAPEVQDTPWRMFIEEFARVRWHTNVHSACTSILDLLGQQKKFVVLGSYGLRPVPDWAKPGVFVSTAAMVEDRAVSLALPGAAEDILTDLVRDDPRGYDTGINDRYYRDSYLRQMYRTQANQIADSFIRPVARQIGIGVATEFIHRPWAYEITPPDAPEPPFHGLSPEDRKLYFTVLAAALQTDMHEPRVLLPSLFRAQSNKLVAYAQAEMFNWMEFFPSDGSQRYDEVTLIPEMSYLSGTSRYQAIVGAPRAWRVTSTAGWDWRARLSYSDALYQALQVNDEFRGYLEQAGVSNPTKEALDEVNLH